MDKEEFLEKVKAIGTCEDDVERRSMLAEMEEGISNIFDSNTELTEKNTKLSEDCESLRSANMKLFLRVGESKSESERIKNETGSKSEEPKRKFEDLFNEKGGIK